ncbi:hypothetical protein [Salinispora pacifica]|uniref:hypothetical protein n=1 Tax=Salinispora pacifica TaxID=351187 RepID=UPI0012BC245C
MVLDNSAYESTGGQPTRRTPVAWDALARSVGYRHAHLCRTAGELRAAVEAARSADGPHLIGVRIGAGGATPPRVSSEFTNAQIAARFSAATAG